MAFAKVLLAIEKGGCMSWYGDITDANGKEQTGLIITRKSDAGVGEGRREKDMTILEYEEEIEAELKEQAKENLWIEFLMGLVTGMIITCVISLLV